MQEEFRVYGREGEPCVRCGTPIEKTRVGGRGTWFCPTLPAARPGRMPHGGPGPSELAGASTSTSSRATSAGIRWAIRSSGRSGSTSRRGTRTSRPALSIDLRHPGPDRARSTCGGTARRSVATPRARRRAPRSRRCAAGVLVYVDCWTSLGGSQFLDSPGTGRYHTYLCDEIVPWVDARYDARGLREHRGITGKSSGGYGAMVTPMLRPDLFGGLATHAGDALFENCYLPEFRESRGRSGRVRRLVRALLGGLPLAPRLSKDSTTALLNDWCMAACYSADDGTVALPFDPATGELVPEVWERWLDKDPVRMARMRGRAPLAEGGLHRLRQADEYYLDLGAEAFRRELEAGACRDVSFELFDAPAHGGIEYRYPLGVKYLAERLGRGQARRRRVAAERSAARRVGRPGRGPRARCTRQSAGRR